VSPPRTPEISDGAWERGYAAQVAVQEHHEASVGTADFLGRLSTTVAGLVDAGRVVFSLLDETGRLLVPQAAAHEVSEAELALLGTVPVDPEGDDPASRVVYRNEVLRTDVRVGPAATPAAEALRRLGAEDAVSVCWRAGSRPLGTLTAIDSRSRGFTDDDVRVLRTAAQASGMVWRHKQVEAELARLCEDARDAQRAMDGFVSMVVHELRGPLTVIGGYAGMIARGDLGEPPEIWRRPLGFLVEHAGRMRRLVDDLLLAARVSAGGESLAARRLDLRTAVAAALDRATPGAELAGARLEGSLPDQPVPVVADPEHLGLILDNLLINAVAYGGSPAQVEVAVTRDATVLVTDHGGGVPEEMRERIFDRFVRVEGPGSPPGTGLGLYISRELATHLGGSLRLVAAEPGRGSTFALRLPLAGGAEEAPADPLR
jgi:signal transduction histidine kinase